MQLFERIKHLITVKKISVSQLARMIGQTENSIYNYANGKNIPTVPVLSKIALEYPDINSDWLLTGRGEMLLSDTLTANIGAVNNGIASVVAQTYNNASDCEKEVIALKERLQAANTELALKSEIIDLLREKLDRMQKDLKKS